MPRLAQSVSLATSATLATLATLALPPSAQAVLELRFVTAPALPTLPSVKLNAKGQTATTAMTGFSVEDTRLTKSGWNLVAQGQTGADHSPVFAQYCPEAACGTIGYVAGGFTLPAGSLVLNSGGATFTGGLGTAPTLQCASGCVLDGAAAVKIASDASGVLAGEGTWTAGGFSASSLALSVPATLRALPKAEVYRADVLWTLSTGP
jgi:hypothetical protein